MKPDRREGFPEDFRHKKIEIAPSTGIDMFVDIAEDFMQKVFNFEPGNYLITDESSLSDFTGLEIEIKDLYQKIREIYDLDVSDIESGNLLDIFMRIHRHRFGSPS